MSCPKKSKLDEEKQILVFRDKHDWKVFTPSSTMEKFLDDVNNAFQLRGQKLYNNNGSEITDIMTLRHMDTLFISDGTGAPPLTLMASIALGESTCHSEWIRLNVGGESLVTTRETLTAAEPGSKLAIMFSRGLNDANLKRDSRGAILLDRDPQYFAALLNYLRYRQVIVNNNVSLIGVLEEARYFEIESLVKKIEERMQRWPSMGAGKQEGTIAVYGSSNHPFSREEVVAALARIPYKSLRFQAADFTGADLSRLDLNHINFKWAILRKCKLNECNLEHCSFEQADLHGAIMEKANARGARFHGANFTDVKATSCLFACKDDPLHDRASFMEALMTNTVLDGSSLYGADFTRAEIRNARMHNCDMRTANMAGAYIQGCTTDGSLKEGIIGWRCLGGEATQ